MENKFKMVATTFAGLEDVLANELTELGAEDVAVLKRAVSFVGDQKMLYKANYECRCALRILKPVFEFYSETEEEFYKAIKNFKWWEVLDIKDTFAIDTVAFNSHLEHTQYITLKAKDAIADCFTEKMNRRPFVDTENPKLKVNIHLADNHCSISFDSSGAPLFKRGYRFFTNEAPINEVLAAGLIKMTGWHGECNFMDPMCGSGTFLIEAAMVAQNIPAGYYRLEWGFMSWKDFDQELWETVREEGDDRISESECEIIGSDISRRNINIARENITRSKLHRDIKVEVMPIEEQHGVGETGIAIVNPPYGKRMRPEEIDGLYKQIGDAMKKNFKGYKFFVISSDFLALKRIGLKTSSRINVFNGPLECKFLCFELYEGSRRIPRESVETDELIDNVEGIELAGVEQDTENVERVSNREIKHENQHKERDRREYSNNANKKEGYGDRERRRGERYDDRRRSDRSDERRRSSYSDNKEGGYRRNDRPDDRRRPFSDNKGGGYRGGERSDDRRRSSYSDNRDRSWNKDRAPRVDRDFGNGYKSKHRTEEGRGERDTRSFDRDRAPREFNRDSKTKEFGKDRTDVRRDSPKRYDRRDSSSHSKDRKRDDRGRDNRRFDR